MSQQGSIMGTVKSRNGEAQIGATVQVKGTEDMSVTGEDAAYQIHDVPAGNVLVTASMVLAEQTKEARVPADGVVVLDFTLDALEP